MNGWTTRREPEKPKTAAGKRALLRAQIGEVLIGLGAVRESMLMVVGDTRACEHVDRAIQLLTLLDNELMRKDAK